MKNEVMHALNGALMLSETFYSIQGEGPCSGVPAVFLRLGGCNLRCEGFSYKDPNTNEHLGCDTKHVWRNADKKNFERILSQWHEQGWLSKLEEGAHLVITGGEPLLQQRELLKFVQVLDGRVNNRVFIELETNATVKLNEQLLLRINQINASPKLVSSGEPRARAYCEDVLLQLSASNHAIFKFVVSTEVDVEEVIQRYITPFLLDKSRVYLMPEGGTIFNLSQNERNVVEFCKRFGFRYCPRLHIHIWDEATGV